MREYIRHRLQYNMDTEYKFDVANELRLIHMLCIYHIGSDKGTLWANCPCVDPNINMLI